MLLINMTIDRSIILVEYHLEYRVAESVLLKLGESLLESVRVNGAGTPVKFFQV